MKAQARPKTRPGRPAASSPTRPTIRSQLLDVITSRGLSAYSVAIAAGLDPGTVKRWMTGRRDLYFESAAAICLALDVRLVEVAQRPRPAKRPPPISAQ